MLKKYLATAACIVLAVSSFASCSGSSSSSSTASSGAADSNASSAADTSEMAEQNVKVPTKLVIDGKEVTDTESLVMCTVGGFDISFDEFRYYWLYYLNNMKAIGYDIENDTETTINLIKFQVDNDLVSNYGLMAYARDNDLAYTISQTDFEDAYFEQLMAYQTEEQYAAFLEENYLTDSALQSTLHSYLASNVAYTSLFGEDGGKFYVAPDAVKELLNSEDAIRCVEVFVPFSACVELTDEEKEGWEDKSVSDRLSALNSAYNKLDDAAQEEADKKSLELAQQVCDKAKNGEDFYSLMEQYGYATDLTPKKDQSYSDIAGYYFTDEYSAYTDEFKKAAFALKDNEISDVVTSKDDGGYHIIMRLPKDSEYIESNIADLAEEYNTAHAGALFNEYCKTIEITYSDEYGKLDLDSIS